SRFLGRLGALSRFLLSASELLAILFGVEVSALRVLIGERVWNGQRCRTLGALDFTAGFLRGNLQSLLARFTMKGDKAHRLTSDKEGNGNTRVLVRGLSGAPCSGVVESQCCFVI